MIGAIAGDVIGSVHEGTFAKRKDFPLFVAGSRFTDDSVLTVAIASAIEHATPYESALREWGRRYPDAGYGGWFIDWLWRDDATPYNSFGNGSAMRVSPVAWAFSDLPTTLAEARRTAEVTHDHPEGIKGAEAIAAAVFLSRNGSTKDQIRSVIETTYGYDCSTSLDVIRRQSTFDVTCQVTVPAALVAFLAAEDFEDAVRNAVSLGGDTDTLACMAGAVAEAFFGGVPRSIAAEVLQRLDAPLREQTLSFTGRYCTRT